MRRLLIACMLTFPNTLLAADPASVPLLAPLPQQVVQRQGFVPSRAHEHQPGGPELGWADVPVVAEFPAAADNFEYRVVLLEGAFGRATDWTALVGKLEQGMLQSMARVQAGGWYRLEVRALAQQTPLAVAAVEPVGVGEVFLIAGQSYATNTNDERLKIDDPAGRVVSFDAAKNRWQVAHDPQPTPDGSDGGSIWPPFGNLLLPVARVPLGFVNAAVGGTSSTQWLPGGPLHERLIADGKRTGRFRAVLWQQGESDVIARTSLEQYVANIQTIHSTAATAWGFEPPWLLAKSTLHPTVYHRPEEESRIRQAIDLLARQPGFRPGPDTDILDGPHRGGPQSRRHFTGLGQRTAATLWFASVWGEMVR